MGKESIEFDYELNYDLLDKIANENLSGSFEVGRVEFRKKGKHVFQCHLIVETENGEIKKFRTSCYGDDKFIKKHKDKIASIFPFDNLEKIHSFNEAHKWYNKVREVVKK